MTNAHLLKNLKLKIYNKTYFKIIQHISIFVNVGKRKKPCQFSEFSMLDNSVSYSYNI